MPARSLILGSVFGLVLAACGGGGDSAGDDGPMQGREVGKASQLEGTWLATNEGDFVGFEFMKDGKVLATPFASQLTGNACTHTTYSTAAGCHCLRRTGRRLFSLSRSTTTACSSTAS